MHRHMRSVGDEFAFGIEHGTRKVEPLLDVHRIGGLLESDAHLLGNAHEQIVEDFKHDGIAEVPSAWRFSGFRTRVRIR